MNTEKTRDIIFFSLFGVVLIAFIVLVLPFFYPIFWAAVIAVIFRPLFKKLNMGKDRPNLNAFISVMVVLVIILIPLSIVVTLLINESVAMFNSLTDETSSTRQLFRSAMETLKNSRYTARFNIDEAFLTEKLSEFAREISAFVYNNLKHVTTNVVKFVVMTIIMIYTLFFFIRDGDKLPSIFSQLCPLGREKEKMLLEKFVATTRATLKGTIVIGIAQGGLGGLIFWALGIQSAMVWGVIMIFASVLPVGSAIIWVPASIILLLTAHYWKGVILLSFCIIVIGFVDNFLRPALIGKALEMHSLFILFSTLGGLVLFGISGFVIGPIIASVLLSLWDIYNMYYRDRLSCEVNGTPR